MVDPIRVLCVDAHHAAERTATRLEGEDDRITVETSSSVDEALDRLAEAEFDGVISEYDLPDRNGIAFLETVRNEWPDVPFLLFTGEGDEEAASEAISAGVTEYVRKDGSEVHEALAEQLVSAVGDDATGEPGRRVRQSPEQLLERIADVFIALDDEWRFTYANEAAADVFGKPAGQLIGENIWELYPEATETPFYEHYHEAMAEGKPRTVEEYYEPWDRWYREHIYPTEDGLSVIFRDITEQKRREKERERYRRRMELALEKTASVIFEADLESGDVSRVGTFEQFFDVPPDRVGTWEAFADRAVHPEDRDRFRSVFERLRDGEIETAEIEFRTNPDVAQVEWIRGEIFVEEDDESRRAIGLARDVTERKAYETRLQEERQFVKSVFESLPDPLYAFDTDGYLLRWNEKLEETTGYDADEIEEMYVTDFVPDDERDVIAESFERILSERRSVTVESAFETKAGERVPFEFTGAPLEDADGNLRGATGVGRDVTERKRRETRISGLNDALGEFIDAEDEQTVCSVAIEAAWKRLDLPVTAIALFDDGRGELQLTARTPAAEKRLEARRLLDWDDIAWRAFTSGESTVLDPDDFDEYDLVSSDSVDRLVVYPLGRHGVFVTAIEFDGREDVEMDFVRTVAENLRGALDRVERETLLRERETELEARNETLDRLNRINDIIRAIDRELVAATSRSGIERTVCEQLTEAGPYRFAWIAEYDSRQNRVLPREHGGVEEGYLDAIPTAVGNEAESGNPTAEAIRTGEPQVIADVRTEPPYEQWREAALRRNYRSVVALPIVYRDRLYGVLTIYADRPELVAELEREVLAELADNVAHAIGAIELRHALASDTVVELDLRVPISEMPLFEAIESGSECVFTLETVVPDREGMYRVRFTARGVTPQTLLDSMDRSPAIRDAELIAERAESNRFECLVADENLLTWLLDHGVSLRTIAVKERECRITVHLPQEEDVREFVELFESRYAGAEMLARRERSRPGRTHGTFEAELEERLTPRQREMLELAYANGYFESPREQTASELADVVGISQPTFTRHLRAGQRKLLDLLYGTDELD